MATAYSSSNNATSSHSNPDDPLWRYTQQIQLLLQLLGIDASDHAKELEMMCLAHKYCAPLTQSVDINAETTGLTSLSQAAIDNAAETLAADGGIIIWRPEDKTNQQ